MCDFGVDHKGIGFLLVANLGSVKNRSLTQHVPTTGRDDTCTAIN